MPHLFLPQLLVFGAVSADGDALCQDFLRVMEQEDLLRPFERKDVSVVVSLGHGRASVPCTCLFGGALEDGDEVLDLLDKWAQDHAFSEPPFALVASRTHAGGDWPAVYFMAPDGDGTDISSTGVSVMDMAEALGGLGTDVGIVAEHPDLAVKAAKDAIMHRAFSGLRMKIARRMLADNVSPAEAVVRRTRM